MKAVAQRRPSASLKTSRAEDPRIVRSRAAVVRAATRLFLEQGYAGTTMEDIAAAAGITKRTVYNIYADKESLFTQIVTDVIAYAEEFARDLHGEFSEELTARALPAALRELAERLALGVLRPEVVALRRLLIGEARTFPTLAKRYFDRAPGRVMAALAEQFEYWNDAGLLTVPDARAAARQFAYLVVGEPLDRATLAGTTTSRAHVLAGARDGVETFLARFARTKR